MVNLKLRKWIWGRKGNLWMRALLGGLALLTLGCQEENPPAEYQNVQREMALNEFEEAFQESGNQIRALVESGSQEFQKGKIPTLLDRANQHKFQRLLGPVIAKSRKLLETYGITEEFLLQEFKTPDDPRLLLVGLWVSQVERKGLPPRMRNQAQLANFSLLFQENTLSEAKPDWMDCMIIAVGVDAIIEFAKGNVTEAIAKKAIRKIASRTLGWVGVALAVYEYGSCMGWY